MHAPLSEEAAIALRLSTRRNMIDAEAKVVEVHVHASSLQLGPTLTTLEKTPNMRVFTKLLGDCMDKTSLNMLCGSFMPADIIFAASSVFTLLGTASKSKIADFVACKHIHFRKIAMATSFQQSVRSRDFSGSMQMSDAQMFVGTGGNFKYALSTPVSCIMYSAAVDSILWCCEYPQKEVSKVLVTCHMMAIACTYDFEGQHHLFRLWQSLSAYVACLEVGRTQELEVDPVALRKAIGIHEWLQDDDNVIAFQDFSNTWQKYNRIQIATLGGEH
jgi:hypothetical protein